MKKLITKILTILIVIFTVLLSAYSFQNSHASEQTHKIEYVQCVVIDSKVHSCTNITDGKLIDTAKINEVYKK